MLKLERELQRTTKDILREKCFNWQQMKPNLYLRSCLVPVQNVFQSEAYRNLFSHLSLKCKGCWEEHLRTFRIRKKFEVETEYLNWSELKTEVVLSTLFYNQFKSIIFLNEYFEQTTHSRVILNSVN